MPLAPLDGHQTMSTCRGLPELPSASMQSRSAKRNQRLAALQEDAVVCHLPNLKAGEIEVETMWISYRLRHRRRSSRDRSQCVTLYIYYINYIMQIRTRYIQHDICTVYICYINIFNISICTYCKSYNVR